MAPSRARAATFAAVALAALAGCGGGAPPAGPRDLAVTELAAVNTGGGPTAARDEAGEYDDWIELVNRADHPVDLAGLVVSDRDPPPAGRALAPGVPLVLQPGERLLLFADDEVHQGPLHLPFRLDRDGETLHVFTSTGARIARVAYGPHGPGASWVVDAAGQGALCRTPTPGQPERCEPPPPPPPREYPRYPWPEPWPALAPSLVLSELSPGGPGALAWVELLNRGDAPVDLAGVRLEVAPAPPASPSPGPGEGEPIPLDGALAPGARRVVSLPAPPGDEDVILLSTADGASLDALAPGLAGEGAVLARPEDGRGAWRSCDAASASPGEVNLSCAPPPPRGARPAALRQLGSEADFEALAAGEPQAGGGAVGVKVVLDRRTGALFFFDSARWPLHHDFVHEAIDGSRPFDLCDPAGRAAHGESWGRFSAANYMAVEGRRYLLGTLVRFADADLWTLELAAGDRITPAMIEALFFEVARRLWDGRRLAWRPTTDAYVALAEQLLGRLPIVRMERPFEGLTFQALNPAVGYGWLTRVEVGDLDAAAVSDETLLVLDRIPAELPPVAGTITEVFQTPLAHVNVLAQGRGTPNMALARASIDPRVAPLLGRLARLEVRPDGFDLRAATSTEAEAFWRSRRGERPRLVPRLDARRRSIVDLATAGIEDAAVVGAKAAQFAELARLDWRRWSRGAPVACARTRVDPRLPVPRPAFAIPFWHFFDHLARSGLDAEVRAMLADPGFAADPRARRERLAALSARIREAPVNPELLSALEAVVRGRFGRRRVRFRSSTSVEDLVGFNGAGLYASASAQVDASSRDLADALREVWASVYGFRAFEERRLANVDEAGVAMAVLVHPAFPGEEANGVAITRNAVDLGAHGYYVNAQVGEISVVDPPLDALPEQLVYKHFAPPEVVVLGRSSILAGEPVLRPAELDRLACILGAVHARFLEHHAAEVDPARFAIDAEFKVVGPAREVWIKQARPWVPPAPAEPVVCPGR